MSLVKSFIFGLLITFGIMRANDLNGASSLKSDDIENGGPAGSSECY